MARFTFKLPDIGEGISEAEIVAWHVAVGDRIEEDQQVADMMTDKATVEMESPVSGVVVELAGEVGDQVAIGAALVVIETDAVAEEAPAPAGLDTAVVEAENPGVEAVASTPLPPAGGGKRPLPRRPPPRRPPPRRRSPRQRCARARRISASIWRR